MKATNKPQNLYLVRNSRGRALHIWAVSSNQAKRIYCKEYGIRPSDSWCGLSDLTARKLKPEEAKAWEDQAGARHDTAIFIHGMLEICAKTYEERTVKT